MKQIRIRIHAGAKTSAIRGKLADGTWKLSIASPPVEGRANKELIRFLAEILGVPPSSIQLLKGHTSKQKTVGIPDHVSLEDADL